MSFTALQHLEHCYRAIQPATENSPEAFAWFSGIRDPFLNPVIHLHVADKVDELLKKGDMISFWVHPWNEAKGLVDLLKTRHFRPFFTCHLMAWDVKKREPTSSGIKAHEEDIFFDIVAKGFHMNEEVKEHYRSLNWSAAENYTLFLEGQAATSGTLVAADRVGAIFNIATLPEHQKKGCFKSMMEYLMHRADTLKLKQLVLVAAPGTETLYAALGFVKLFDIEVWTRSEN